MTYPCQHPRTPENSCVGSNGSKRCRRCKNIAGTESARRRREKRKKCTRCGEIKTREEFTKDSTKRSGMGAWCKECFAEYKRGVRRGIPTDEIVRLRRLVGLPDDGPTPEMREQWHKREVRGWST